jgi:hypothetical protein
MCMEEITIIATCTWRIRVGMMVSTTTTWAWDRTLTFATARETDDDTDTTPTQAVQYIPDDTPTEFVPYGPKVVVYQFSIPCYDALPADTKCPICCYTVQETPGEAWVLARCSGRHAYHEVHLDEWVNGAAENANTCPLDREVLCVARERVHRSALERAQETVR